MIKVDEVMIVPQEVYEIRRTLVQVSMASSRISEACAIMYDLGPNGAVCLVDAKDGSHLSLQVYQLLMQRIEELKASFDRLATLLDPEEQAEEAPSPSPSPLDN